ncbi:cytochrome P450 [Rhizorhabdus histidinilytica]|uniref:Cytochrome P450 n=1 Tax=Rhizorhabdus histidinilytica TaxID=439228 RepID=A0A1T5GUK2_9SPHN|nr:cytochrome P450 [Rhizorhabdus histidinilytica]SKC12000.1 Cytochrome P450 [Rhizorhabdus histidinilytica]
MNSYTAGAVPAGDIPDNVPIDRVFDVDCFNLAGIEEGYQEACKRLQAPGMPNMIWTPRNGGHWIVTRGKLVRDVLNSPDRFSSQVIVLPKEAGEKYDLLPTRLDPPQHGGHRAVINKTLNPREMRRIESSVRQIAIDLIEPLVAKGRCDFSLDFAQQFPIRVFMKMVDLPMTDAPLLKHYATQILRPDGANSAEMAISVENAVQGFYAYLEPVINERRGNDGTDMVSIVINSEIDGAPISQADALSLIANLLLAGLDTVVSFLSFMMLFLGRNPEHLKQLADNPASIPQSVEELLRRFPIVSDARMVTDDFEYDGVMLKRGDMVQVPTALAGLDEEMNEDPWKVIFNRKKLEHSTFGGGPHRCAGLHLARMEITITLQEWLARIPSFRVTKDANPIFSSGMVAMVENVPLEWDVA